MGNGNRESDSGSDDHLIKMGFAVHRTTGARQSVLAAVGKRIDFDIRELEVLPGVQGVHRISAPYKLVGRTFRAENTVVRFGNGVEVGGKQIVVMAGPCSVESREPDLPLCRNGEQSRERKSCAAARSSLAARLTPSRDSAGRAEADARSRRTLTACW